MTFDTAENSNYDGHPSLLFLFFRSNATTQVAKSYTYTSADRDVVAMGYTFEAVPISEGGYSMTGNPSTDTFQVTLPIDTDVSQLFQGAPPSDTVWLNVYRMHDADEIVSVWSGIVNSRNQTDELTAVLTCQSLASTFSGGGLRCAWGRGCQHFLYDNECTVNPALFAQPCTVTQLDGSQIQVMGVDGYEGGYFNGGYIEWTTDGGVTFTTRMIIGHSPPTPDGGGGWFQMLGGTYGITPSMTIVAHPGCDRTSDTCLNKFNNLDNFGGIIHLPGKSPFDGEIVF